MDKRAAIKLLEPFIGVWNTTGILEAGLGNADIEVKGTDSYEWMPGGFFMLHKVDVMMGEERNESLEIIGYDEDRQTFTMHAFDNKGVETTMSAEYKNGLWLFYNAQLRFEGGFNDKRTLLSGSWLQKDDHSHWQQFIRICLEKS